MKIEDRVRFLERENELLNSIIQGAIDSIYAKDRDGRYISINEAGAKVMGMPIDEIIGKSDLDVFGEYGIEIREWDRQLFDSGKHVSYESTLIKDDGIHHFSTSKSPLHDANGNIIGLIGISRDITEAKEAEKKYRFIFENAPVALWEEDFSEVKHFLNQLETEGVEDVRAYFERNPQELERCIGLIKVLNVNHSTLDMNAVKTKESLSPNLTLNFTPESDNIFIDEMVALASGKTEFKTEGSFVNVKGEVLDVIFTLSVMPGHEETLSLVLATVVDVTDMRKMAHELTAIKHRYQSIVEAQTEMICRLNPKGNLLFRNSAFNQFFQFKVRTEAPRFVSLFPPDEVDLCEKKLRSLSASKPAVSCELRNYDESGGIVWQHWTVTAFYGGSGVLLGYQAVGTDITDRKLAEEALAASEARWRSVFTHADDLILSLNTSGTILSINDYAGLPKDRKWAGSRIEEVLNPVNASRVMTLLKNVVAAGVVLKTELTINTDEGGRITFGVVLSPIMHGKRVISVVCIARDITQTKAIELQTKEALIEGQEKERRRVAQELHDGLGQLFTAMKLNIQQMKASSQTFNETSLEGIEMLESNLGVAINEVKNISKDLMPDVLWQFGLKPAVEDLVEKLDDSIDVTISLDVVKMDERLASELEKALFRVCQELLNNSIKHGGCKNIFVQLIKHEDSVVLMVEDDGVGFDPNETHSGSGLKNIQSRVEVFSGRVEVDSSPNQGTVSTIEIPL